MLRVIVVFFVVVAFFTAARSESSLAGNWRVFSSRIFYDAGGGGGLTSSTRPLELQGTGGWRFGSSSGSWRLANISAGDWSRWGVSAYGPTRKIILEGWQGGTADGPLEEDNGGVNFLWVIYRVGPPLVSNAGQIQTRFGRR